MKYVWLTLCLITLSFNLDAQTKAEKDKAKYEEKIEEHKTEYINNIVNGFDDILDEFQKHVLTQRLHTYYQELQKINTLDVKTFERTSLKNDLNATHFKDFEEMLGEEFVSQLIEKVRGKDKSDQKRKNKKRKKDKS